MVCSTGRNFPCRSRNRLGQAGQPLTGGIDHTMRPFAYNPDIQPNAEDWLALDEQARLSLVRKFHRRAKIELPNVEAHAIFHTIIENQVALGVESVMRAIPRLMQQGLSRHDAVHAVASVLAEHMHEQATETTEDSVEVAAARYDAAVERLTVDGWFTRFDEE